LKKKKALLVTVEFTTRVIVDEDASAENIFEAARPRLKQKAAEEMFENVSSIEPDIECPFGTFDEDNNPEPNKL
jgi:hypothetical protein